MRRSLKYLYQEVNIIDVFAAISVLALASIFEFAFHELPCPLCVLQRAGFFLIAIGFLMNLKFGAKPSHYALATLAAVYTGCVSARQVLLHIAPNTGNYGPPLLGLHLYTWTFLASVAFVLWISFQLMYEKQFHKRRFMLPINRWLKIAIHLTFIAIIALSVIDLISVLMECGFNACPESPSHYLY